MTQEEKVEKRHCWACGGYHGYSPYYCANRPLDDDWNARLGRACNGYRAYREGGALPMTQEKEE